MIPPYLVEWFVVPLVMFLFLFWLRDNLNILHMPLADLVALLVIADVAIAMNFSDLPIHGGALDLNLRRPGSPGVWWSLAGLGVATCVLLVYGVENKIRRVAIHHISVGLWHHQSSSYLGPLDAFRTQTWQIFTARWAAGFGITALFLALHLVVVGIDPLRLLDSVYPQRDAHWAVEVALSGIGTFAVFLVLGTLFTVVGIFRYSEVPLPWTYLLEDRRPNS